MHEDTVLPTIMVGCEAANVQVRLEINDCPIATGGGAQGLRHSGAANEWCRPGQNEVSLRIAWPGELPYAEGIGRCSAWIRAALPGEPASAGRLLWSFDWPIEDRPEGYPHLERGRFELKDFPGTRLWTDATRLQSLAPRDRTDINNAIAELHLAYERRDLGAVMTLSSVKFAEYARAYGEDVAERRASAEDFAHALFDTQGWGMEPLDTDSLSAELIAEGRLVWMTTPVGNPPLRSVPTEEFQWNGECYFGKLANGWTLLR